MPLLAWLGSIFGTIVAFFATYFSKRLAIVLAVVASITALTIGFTAALNALLYSVQYSYPVGWIAKGIGLLPSNTSLCISAIFSSYLLRWVYEWKVRIIQYQLF